MGAIMFSTTLKAKYSYGMIRKINSQAFQSIQDLPKHATKEWKKHLTNVLQLQPIRCLDT